MDENMRKSRLSLSYIETVTYRTGYHVSEPKVDVDSVDGTLRADFGRRPRIEFQAKATSQDIVRGDTLNFPLDIDNYNDLRVEDVMIPRILIVMRMPDAIDDWISQSQEELRLRHCAYWLCLEGYEARQNTSTVTVHIPTANVFNVEQLESIMQKTERGESLC